MLVKVFAVVWMGIIVFWDVTLCEWYLIPNIMRQLGGLTFTILKFHENLQILVNGTTSLSKHQEPNTL